MKEAPWHLAQGPLAIAIAHGRVANPATKKRAERSQTLKADFKANVRHAQPSGKKQLLGLLNSPVNQVLVRRGFERIPKEPEKVITRQTSLL